MSDWTDLDAAEEESNPDAGWEDDAPEEDADAQAGEAKEADEDAVAPAGDEEQAAVAPAGDEEQQVDGTPRDGDESGEGAKDEVVTQAEEPADEETRLMPVMDGEEVEMAPADPKDPKTQAGAGTTPEADALDVLLLPIMTQAIGIMPAILLTPTPPVTLMPTLRMIWAPMLSTR